MGAPFDEPLAMPSSVTVAGLSTILVTRPRGYPWQCGICCAIAGKRQAQGGGKRKNQRGHAPGKVRASGSTKNTTGCTA